MDIYALFEPRLNPPQRDAPFRHKDDGHAERCIAANYNILSLYGDRLPYNICRNLEWQARGGLAEHKSISLNIRV